MAVRNNFLRALSPQTFDQIKPRLHARKFPLGDTLFRRGDTIANVYFLNSGGISLVSELAGGHMVESAMIGSDSVVAGGAALDDGEAVLSHCPGYRRRTGSRYCRRATDGQ